MTSGDADVFVGGRGGSFHVSMNFLSISQVR